MLSTMHPSALRTKMSWSKELEFALNLGCLHVEGGPDRELHNWPPLGISRVLRGK